MVTLRGHRDFFRRRHQDLTQRIFGGTDVARQLNVGHVEGLARLIEAVRLRVFRQGFAQVEPRRMQEVTQGVLVFETIEPTFHRPAFRLNARIFSDPQFLA